MFWLANEDRAEPELGKFAERDLPDYSSRDFEERGFTIGIGGCVALSRGSVFAVRSDTPSVSPAP